MNKTLFLLSLVPGLVLGAAGDIPVEQADGTFASQSVGGDASLAADGALTVSGGDADTAGALAANGANCSAGNAPLGVDTAGAAEGCFDVWTEAENTAAGYLSAETDPVWALSPSYGITADQVTHWDTAYGWGDHAAAGYLDAADIGVSVQAYDAELAAIAGLVSAADTFPYFTGNGSATLGTVTAAARSILDDTSTSAIRTTLGVGTGSSPQFTAVNIGHATDTTITRTAAGSIAVEGNEIYRAGGTDVPVTDGGTGASYPFAARTNLGLAIGTDVQAYDADLTTWAGLTPSTDAQSFVTAANYAAMQGLLSIDDLITLSGAAEGSTTLGTFTGSTIPDNQTIKQALQALESVVGTAAGADTQIQWNNAGALGAASTFTYDDSTYTFKLGYDGSNYCTWVSAADGALTLSCFGTDADLNINLSGATDGDFSVNTNDLFVDTSAGSVGINTVTPNSSSKLDVYGKIYQNGVQSLYNPSATLTGTLVVGDGGGSLSHTSGSDGYYNTFVGMNAGGSETTQTYVTATGYNVATSNTGNYVTAIGTYSVKSNTGNYVTANGGSSAQNNTGNYVTAIGTYPAQNNTGANVTASGYASAQNNIEDNVTASGYASAQNNIGKSVTATGYKSANYNTGNYVTANGSYTTLNNTGANVTANGYDSAQYNSKNNVTALGYGAYNTWTNGTSYSVTSADAGAETVTVTGHGITIGTYKPLIVSGAGVGGLSNGVVYTFKAVDANTLAPLGSNITSSGTTTLYANSNDFTNVTALGYNAEPTKDNQVMLGDTNVVEVKTYGTMLDIGGAITARELGSDPADPDEGSHVCWQSDGTGTGDDGDIICKITAGGTTKTTTLIDFSAL